MTVNIIFLLLSLAASPVLGLGQKTGGPEALPPGRRPARELKGGETHSYIITLKAGEYFHVEVDQHGIDILLRMFDSNGNMLLERDRPNHTNGQESLSFQATTGGDYYVEVQSPGENATPGKYTIKSETPRTPTARDKKRIKAENLFQEALRLAQTKTTESLTQSRGKAEAALALWRGVGDKYAEALTYTLLGFIEEGLERRKEAVAVYEKSLSLYREVGDQPGVASSLSRLSILNALQLGAVAALAQYHEALAIYRSLKDANGEKELRTELNTIAEAYLEVGRKFLHQGDAESYRKGLDVFEIARDLCRALGDTYDEAFALVSLGRINDDLGEKQKALDYYNQALPLTRKSGDSSDIAAILNNIGSVLSDLGEKRKALGHYEEALSLWKVESKSGIAATLVNIGAVYDDLGERRKALDYYEKRALPLYIEAADTPGVARTLNSIGSVYSALGQRRKALDYLENKALPIWVAVGDESGIATAYTNIGSVYSALGEKRKALDYLEKKALPLWKKVGRKAAIATAYNNIGGVYSAFGEKQTALDYYEKKALPLFTEAGNKPGIATTYTNIGGVYSELGEKRKALDYIEKKALPVWQAFGRKAGIAAAYNNIGRVYDDLGEQRKALDYYENKALPHYREAEDKSGIAATLGNIGAVYYDLGEQRKALEYENQALTLNREAEDKTGVATTLSNIGRLYSALGEKRKALDYYENQALPLWIELENGAGEAAALHNIMVAWDHLKNPRFATFYGKRAINVLQQLRAGNLALDQESQKTLLKSVESSYRHLAKLLIEQGRLIEAYQVLNAFKDQQQFDFNRGVTKEPPPLVLTQREADFDSRYSGASSSVGNIRRQVEGLRLKAIVRNPTAEESAELRRLESDLKAADEKFAALLRQAEAEFDQPPDPAKDREPRIDELGEMRQTLQALNDRQGSKTVVIYTLVGENAFYALAVTPDTPRGIVATSTPISGALLNDKAKQLWALLQSDKYDPKALSEEVYTLVFQPIKDGLRREGDPDLLLPEGATILWSLDGNLRYLPLAALYDGERYLAERYHNVVFTRADVKQWARGGAAKWTGVGFGSSQAATVAQEPYRFAPLPNAIKELRAVFNTRASKAGVFDGLIFPDAAFTRDAMAAALKGRRPLVHIASHFYFSPGDSTRSYLVLGNRRVFTLNEMKSEIDFGGVELLTLSACETAAQWADADGREVDGFAELAQRLGAGAVLATLWNVRDDSSYWLMREFYRRKQGTVGETKVGALRRAQLALLSGTAKVAPPPGGRPPGGGQNSTFVRILPAGKATRPPKEDGVVYVEPKYATPYVRSRVRPYAHPYFWSPFVLFGNWR